MAQNNNRNLFKRLTHLFRSGPVVKRKLSSGRDVRLPKQRTSIQNLFQKSSQSAYSSTVGGYNSYDRMARISEYSEMEADPIVASALDIYADESTCKDESGKSLHVYSENPKIQRLLNELFFDTINWEFVGRSWARNLCKYGDFMLITDISPNSGIVNVMPVPINEIEREEGYDPEDPFAVRFRWVTQGNQILENWQVAHFRMTGNDVFLPYGTSVIESARRTFRNLTIAEDSALVYRIIRSPERRVFYIDVGNIPPDEIPNHIEQAKMTLKSQEVVDNKAGNVDQRYNPWAVDIDYFLPVRGGETGTKIETLPGGQNTTAIDDIEYFQNKLFAGLKIPKPYLNYAEALSGKANLSMSDIRISRTIRQIQQVMISELNKLATIHLAANGYTGEDLIDFSLQLSNPSTMAEQQQLELTRTRFEIAQSKPEQISDRYVLKNVFGLTDDEIELERESAKEELHFKVKLEQIADGEGNIEGNSGGFSGGGAGGGFDFDDSGEDGVEDFFADDEQPSDDVGGGDDPESAGGEEQSLEASEKKPSMFTINEDEDLQEIDIGIGVETTPVKSKSIVSTMKNNRQRRKNRSGANHPNISKTLKSDNVDFKPTDDRHDKNPFGLNKKRSVKKSNTRMESFMEKQLKQINERDRTASKMTRVGPSLQSKIDSLKNGLKNNNSKTIIKEDAENAKDEE